MSFNFFGMSQQVDSDRDAGATEERTVVKDNAVEKKDAAEKESSADNEEGDDADYLKSQSNSKVECRNCKQTTLNFYYGDENDKGEPIVSFMHCLNCGYDFPYFDQFEKEEKKREDGLDWNAGFFLLVAMLFTIILIRGEDGGLFSNNDERTIIEPIERPEALPPQPDSFSNGEPEILNDAEQFVVPEN